MKVKNTKKKGKSIKRETIKTFAGMFAMLIVISILVLFTTMRSKSSFNTVSSVHLKNLNNISSLKNDITQVIMRYKVISTGNDQSPMNSLQEIKKYDALIKEKLTALVENLKKRASIDSTVQSHLSNLISVEEKLTDLHKNGKKMAVSFLSGDIDAGNAFAIKVKESIAITYNKIEIVSEGLKTQIMQESKGLNAFLNIAFWLGVGGIVLGLGISILLISKYMAFVQSYLEQRTYHLKNYAGKLNEDIEGIVSNLESGVNILSDASRNMSDSGDDLNNSIQMQSAALEESSSSLEEITSMVKQTAEYSHESLAVAKTCQTEVVSGREAISSMKSSMGEISEANERLVVITKIIREIKNKTKIINDIVIKTQLLSFNASIEAARAGEHGKGFAVVAEEVGNLAKMSGQAAQDIRSLIEDSSTKVDEIVENIKERVSSGQGFTSDCVNLFQSIDKGMENLTKMVGSISTATHEQQQGLLQTTEAMREFENANHKNKGVIESTTQVICDIDQQGNNIKGSVENLKKVMNRSSHDLKDLTNEGDAEGRESEGENVVNDNILNVLKYPDNKEEKASIDDIDLNDISNDYQEASGYTNVPRRGGKRF